MCEMFTTAQRKAMQDIKTEIENGVTRDRLRDIAKDLKVKNYSHMNKTDLEKAVLDIINDFVETKAKESDAILNEENATIITPSETNGNALVSAPKRTTDDFINELDNGSIIAVQTAYDKAVSVTVISHVRNDKGRVVSCQCKGRDGTIYNVPRKAILWHKVNKRYPAWVYEKIKRGEGERYAKVEKSENMG